MNLIAGRYGVSEPKEKRCVNSTWDLYFAVDFFCCDQDAKGFEVNSNGYVGCASLDEVLPEGQTALSIIVSGSISSSTTISSSTASSTSSPISTTTSLSASLSTSITTSSTSSIVPSPSSTASSTNTAAIAGGVAGGAVALAILAFIFWYLRSYRARSTRLNERAIPPTEIQGTYIIQPKGLGWPQELEGQSYRPELDSQPIRQEPQELPVRI